MLDIHITEFYTDIGKIFFRLYKQFPRQISLWVDEICGPDTPDDYGLHSDRYMACYSAFVWLKDEGYIRYGDVERQDAFNHCCLTEKGYALLAGIDELLQSESRSIDKIAQALKEKSSTQMESAITQLIRKSYLFKY